MLKVILLSDISPNLNLILIGVIVSVGVIGLFMSKAFFYKVETALTLLNKEIKSISSSLSNLTTKMEVQDKKIVDLDKTMVKVSTELTNVTDSVRAITMTKGNT